MDAETGLTDQEVLNVIDIEHHLVRQATFYPSRSTNLKEDIMHTHFNDIAPNPVPNKMLHATRSTRIQIAQDAVGGNVADHAGVYSLCYTGCSHWYDALMHAFTPTEGKTDQDSLDAWLATERLI